MAVVRNSKGALWLFPPKIAAVWLLKQPLVFILCVNFHDRGSSHLIPGLPRLFPSGESEAPRNNEKLFLHTSFVLTLYFFSVSSLR